MHKNTDFVIAKFDYKASDSHELGIQKGERLTLIDDSSHWWKVMNALGNTGYVPSNYVKRSKQGIFSSLRSTLGRRKSRQEGTTSTRPSNPSSPTPDASNGFSSLSLKNDSIESVEHRPSERTCEVIPPTLALDKLSLGEAFPNSCATSDNYQTTAINNPVFKNPDGHMPLGGWTANSDVKHFYSQNSLINSRSLNVSSQNGTTCSTMMHDNNSNSFVLANCAHSNQSSTLQNSIPVSQEGDIITSAGPHYFGTGTGLGRQICQARFAYLACQPDELTIERGDKIRVLEKSSDGWWRGILVTDGRPQRMGWFPSNYVTLDLSKNLNRTDSSSQPSILNSSSLNREINNDVLKNQAQLLARHYRQQSDTGSNTAVTNNGNNVVNITNKESSNIHNFNPSTVTQTNDSMNHTYDIHETVLTLYPFARNQAEELSFAANEVLEVLDKPVDDPDWWRCRNNRGEIGLVPQNYVRVLTTPNMLRNPLPQHAHANYDPHAAANFSQSMKRCTDGETLRLTYALRSNATRAYADRPWCWGLISRAECEAMLGQFSLPGEFIIRDSESHPGDLTVTINAGNKTRNFKIHVEHGQYHIGQKVFGSIENLIDHYRTHPIFKNEQEKHYLTRPFVHPGPAEASRTAISIGIYASTNNNNNGNYNQSIISTHNRCG